MGKWITGRRPVQCMSRVGREYMLNYQLQLKIRSLFSIRIKFLKIQFINNVLC